MLTRYVQHHLTWIDLISPTPTEVRGLMHEFGIDPMIAEELLIPSYKPKVERRGEVIYAIFHYPVLRGVHQRPDQEIDFVIGKNFLITARYGSIDRLHAFAKAFEVDAVLERTGAMHNGGHLFAAMMRNLYHALLNECEALNHHLSEIEEKIFKGDERKMVVQISQTGRTLHDFRQAIIPHEEMIRSLEPVASRLFGQEYSFYIRGIEGEYRRVRNMLDHVRESLVEMRETNNSLLSTKQNDVMKTLTVLTFLVLPLSLITNIFSMNTAHTPLIGSQQDFWLILAGMAVIAVLSVIYFKHKDWL